jgi:DNA-binding GntR family transcriptional regulator
MTEKRRRVSSVPSQNFGILQSGNALLVYFGLSGRVAPSSRSNSYTDAAISIIRNRILDLTLPPGSRIDDRILMERFGMGRTPAREAFNRLAAEGLIIIQRNKGAFVRPMDITHIRQFFDAYIASERVVAFYCRTDDSGLADDLEAIEREYQQAYAKHKFPEMTQLNGRFHGRLAVATQNEYVAEHALRLYNHARRLSYFVSLMEKDFIRELNETQDLIKADHDDILDTVRRGDNAKLVDVLTRHASMFHSRVMRIVSETRGESSPLPLSLDQQAASVVPPVRERRKKAQA